MFEFFTDAVEDVLDVIDAVLSGGDITKRQVAQMVTDGFSIMAIATATGLATSTIEKMLK